MGGVLQERDGETETVLKGVDYVRVALDRSHWQVLVSVAFGL
jgi:hypothetical protein